MTDKIISGHFPKGSIPELWDGNTAVCVVDNIQNLKSDLVSDRKRQNLHL